MRTILAISGSTVISLFLITARTSACTCANESIETRRNRAELVFVGTVISAREPKYTFRVEEVIKGEADEHITVYTGSGSCSTGFSLGKTYIVAAGASTGYYPTGICSGNELLKEVRTKIDESEKKLHSDVVIISVGFITAIAAGLTIWILVLRKAT
jgi:hypothetical protein